MILTARIVVDKDGELLGGAIPPDDGWQAIAAALKKVEMPAPTQRVRIPWWVAGLAVLNGIGAIYNLWFALNA